MYYLCRENKGVDRSAHLFSHVQNASLVMTWLIFSDRLLLYVNQIRLDD